MTLYFTADFVSGAITAGYLVLALLFLRFWRRTRDGLFANFAVAFCLLALNQAMTAVTRAGEFETSGIYLVRLAAFLVIIIAIARKNFRAPRGR